MFQKYAHSFDHGCAQLDFVDVLVTGFEFIGCYAEGDWTNGRRDLDGAFTTLNKPGQGLVTLAECAS
eukprot:SAG31_NODE_37097_length_307_cov_0.850962_1_plen_66_part_01